MANRLPREYVSPEEIGSEQERSGFSRSPPGGDDLTAQHGIRIYRSNASYRQNNSTRADLRQLPSEMESDEMRPPYSSNSDKKITHMRYPMSNMPEAYAEEFEEEPGRALPSHHRSTPSHPRPRPITPRGKEGWDHYPQPMDVGSYEARDFLAGRGSVEYLKHADLNTSQIRDLRVERGVNENLHRGGLNTSRPRNFQTGRAFDENQQPTSFNNNQLRGFQADRGFDGHSQRATFGTSQARDFDKESDFEQHPQYTSLETGRPYNIQAEKGSDRYWQVQDFNSIRLHNLPEAESRARQDSRFPPFYTPQPACNSGFGFDEPRNNQSMQGYHPYGHQAFSASNQTDEYDYAREAPIRLASPQLGQRSRSAQDYYTRDIIDEPPLSPVLASTSQYKALRRNQAVRDAQEEIQFGEKKREETYATRDGILKEYRARGLRRIRSTIFGQSSGASENQSAAHEDGISFPRQPPPVPPATRFGKVSQNFKVGNPISDGMPMVVIGSGLTYLADITKQSEATVSLIHGFLSHNGVERLLKPLLGTRKLSSFLNSLKQLNAMIHWLGDSLWKGGEEARGLFMGIENARVTASYNQMIRTLTELTFEMQKIPREKGKQANVKFVTNDVVAALAAAASEVEVLIRGMEAYVGNIIVGGERFGKGEQLVTRFKRCLGEWSGTDTKPREANKDSKSAKCTTPKST